MLTAKFDTAAATAGIHIAHYTVLCSSMTLCCITALIFIFYVDLEVKEWENVASSGNNYRVVVVKTIAQCDTTMGLSS